MLKYKTRLLSSTDRRERLCLDRQRDESDRGSGDWLRQSRDSGLVQLFQTKPLQGVHD